MAKPPIFLGEYDVGDEVFITGTFRHPTTDALTTPTTTTLRHKDPTGNVATIADGALTTVSTGVKRGSFTVDEIGKWWIRISASGNLTAEQEAYLIVRPRQVT